MNSLDRKSQQLWERTVQDARTAFARKDKDQSMPLSESVLYAQSVISELQTDLVALQKQIMDLQAKIRKLRKSHRDGSEFSV